MLSFVEYRTSAIYHACCTQLERINKLQRRFLRALDVSDDDALQHYSLAPLSARRDMAMLGVIHRSVLGKGSGHFRRFFKIRIQVRRRQVTRDDKRRHPLQLEDPRENRCTVFLTRSALGLIGVYNLLSTCIVSEGNVKAFQSALQSLLRERSVCRTDDWANTYSPRQPLYRHPLRGSN